MKPPTGPSYLGYAALGAGSAGLVYLMLKGSQMSNAQYQMKNQQMGYFNPVVQQRIRQGLMYFGSGLGATGVLVQLLRNSPIAYANPLLLFAGSIGMMFGTMFTSYD
jgi:hypothetical protein